MNLPESRISHRQTPAQNLPSRRTTGASLTGSPRLLQNHAGRNRFGLHDRPGRGDRRRHQGRRGVSITSTSSASSRHGNIRREQRTALFRWFGSRLRRTISSELPDPPITRRETFIEDRRGRRVEQSRGSTSQPIVCDCTLLGRLRDQPAVPQQPAAGSSAGSGEEALLQRATTAHRLRSGNETSTAAGTATTGGTF